MSAELRRQLDDQAYALYRTVITLADSLGKGSRNEAESLYDFACDLSAYFEPRITPLQPTNQPTTTNTTP